MKLSRQAMTVHKSNTLPRNSANRERTRSSSTLSPLTQRKPTHTRQSSQPEVVIISHSLYFVIMVMLCVLKELMFISYNPLLIIFSIIFRVFNMQICLCNFLIF